MATTAPLLAGGRPNCWRPVLGCCALRVRARARVDTCLVVRALRAVCAAARGKGGAAVAQ
eukprot:6805562-Pyramimonas_sp.AAC.1